MSAANGRPHEPPPVLRARIFGAHAGRAACREGLDHHRHEPQRGRCRRRSAPWATAPSCSTARSRCRRRLSTASRMSWSRHRPALTAIPCCGSTQATSRRARASSSWVAYLSTTGVYGDHGGGLVTEETPLTPNTERGHKRLLAETQWLDLWRAHGLPVHIFRLAGIYGPGRNQLLSLLDGTAKRVIKQGQIFSRIHVEDIANVLEASIAKPNPGPRLQCLRRRGLAAAGCGGIWREAAGPSRAARHSLRARPSSRPWRGASMPIQSASRMRG